MGSGDAAKGITGTDFRDRAFVAVNAAIMADLQEKRAVAESVAAFDTFGATDAELLVNGVLIVRIVDVGPLDGRGGAQTILSAGVEAVGLRLEVPRAKLAVAADGVGVHAFDCRLLQDTVRGTIAAAQAFLWINLPHGSCAGAMSGEGTQQTTQTGDGSHPRPVAQELPSGD